jgi:hypothetical protein
VDWLGRTRLRRTPGEERIRYPNFGVAVLGLALTHIYGEATSYEMVQEVVLGPPEIC